MPLGDFPEAFVIRPSFNAARIGVYVMVGGFDLLTRVAYTREELRTRLLQHPRRRSDPLWLVEQFIESENGGGELPVEYKCHTFGGKVGAVEVVLRKGGDIPPKFGFFTPEWSKLSHGYRTKLELDWIDPPKHLDEILECASRLSKVYETYVRSDFYSSDEGCVFGEFSSVPGNGHDYTDSLNGYFERLWQENLGNLI
jgi:hypothetical protein